MVQATDPERDLHERILDAIDPPAEELGSRIGLVLQEGAGDIEIGSWNLLVTDPSPDLESICSRV